MKARIKIDVDNGLVSCGLKRTIQNQDAASHQAGLTSEP